MAFPGPVAVNVVNGEAKRMDAYRLGQEVNGRTAELPE